MGNLKEFAKLSRIQNVGTSIIAVMGALTVKGINLDFLDFLMLFLMAAIINIGGQIINDIKDFEIDKNSKELQERPLVKGTISIKAAIIIVLICLVLLLFIAFLYFGGIIALIVLFSSMFFGYLYNVFSKKIPGSDVFLSISFALFFLYGAIVVTDNFQSFRDIGLITWIVAGMVLIHVQIQNSFQGGLKDAKNDRESGAKTLAVFLGVKVNTKLYIPFSFKAICITLDILMIVLAIIPLLIFTFQYSIMQQVLLILAMIAMLYSAIKLLTMKTFDRKKIKSTLRNHEITRYVLVPIILLNIIGITWALFLILFPMIWLLFFNYLLYKDSWSNPKAY